MSTKKEPKWSWVVKLKCSVTKEVICEDCTESEANSDPWMFARAERELGMDDWEVLDVEENV